MGGSTKTHTEGTKFAGLSVQSSSLGQPIPIGWGRARLSCNLIDFVNFKAIPHTTKTKTGGKGGGGSTTTTETTYTYSVSVMMAICEGGQSGISGIVSVYKDSATFSGAGALTAAGGLNLANGSSSQTAWPYLTSLFPSHALAYRGIAYVYAEDYDLGETASLANHGFEIDFGIQLGGGVVDADPRGVITDFLTNSAYGVPGWSSSLLADLSDYSAYCRANNLLLSPALSDEIQAGEFIRRVLDETNSDCFWSEGVLKIKPFGDASATANGVTWNPDLTPIYDLTDDDFLEEPAIELIDQSDAYNYVTIEYLDRSNQYNPSPTTAYDLDDIVTFGRRQMDPLEWHDICDGQIARTAAQLKLQRVLYVNGKAHFDLPMDFIGLEPMDYLTISTESDELALDRLLVMIEQIDEDEDGQDVLHITGEILPGDTASAALYAAHIGIGFHPDLEADPGNVINPQIFNAPSSMASYEVWCAVASSNPVWGGANVWISFDNVNFSQIGRLTAPATYGKLTSNFTSHADPDTGAGVLNVDLTDSSGVLNSLSSAQADAGVSLAMVGIPPFHEIIAYSAVSLSSPHIYSLGTYIRRGQRSTPIATHFSFGYNPFIRLDDGIFKIPFPADNVGGTLYVKFQSFNIFGRGIQDLASLSSYSVSLALNQAFPGAANGLALALGGSTWTGPRIDLVCDVIDRADQYHFEFYKADGTTFIREVVSGSPVISYTAEMAALDSVGAQREYKIKVRGKNAAGFGPYSSSMLDITNAAPAALSSPSTSGSTASVAQVTATASSDADLGGYVVFYSTTSGFNPKTAGAYLTSASLPVSIFGLPAGTYYTRIAAFDPWTTNPDLLNLSSELTFTITTGGGDTPTGGGGGAVGGVPGTGYGGRDRVQLP